VAQKFAGYNPLRAVFKTEPSQLEVAKLMNALGEDNRQSVQGSLRLFNAYAEQIGVHPDFGRPNKESTSTLPKLVAFDLTEARRRAAGY
jgi:hypothetical protein